MKKLLVFLLLSGILSFIPSSLHPFIPSSLHHFFSSSLLAQIPSNGLVAWYPFNGNANDESGNGNNGTVNGATLTSDRFGNNQSCYSFDGNSWIVVANSSTLNNSSVSISGWFYSNDLATDDNTGCKAIIGKWWQNPSSCNSNYNAHLCVLTKPGSYCTLGSATSFYEGNVFTANESISTGQWYHFSFVHDENSGGKIYINGQLVNQNSTPGSICNSINSLHIGADISNGSLWRFFNGLIDDITIYNRALNGSEIQQLYQDQTGQVQQPLTCNITAPKTNLCIGESVDLSISATGGAGSSSQLPANLQQGLVAYYPFNGNANDESGNGNNGTVSGATLTSDRFGNANAAYNFVGNDDDKITGTFSQPIESVHTYSFWAKNNSSYISGKQWVFSTGTPTLSNAVHFGVSSNIVRIGSWGTDGLATNGTYNSNWNHYVVICSNGNYSLFQNGELINASLFKQTSILGGAFEIGSQLGAITEAWDGQIDDLIIFNRALSLSEIQQLYTAQSYAWSNGATTNSITVSPTTNTSYSCTVTQGDQTCTASVDITVNPAVTNAISATIIEGDSYTLGTQTLTTAGTYTEVFTSAAGCDSTVILTLAVEPLLTCNITAPTTNLCIGESVNLTISTTGGAGSSSQLPANLQQGLVAYYPFNGNANDESGNGNNGTVNGATLTIDRFGNANSAYSFDGVNDLIGVNNSNILPGGFTLNCWYKTNVIQAQSIYYQGGQEFHLQFAEGNRIVAGVKCPDDNWYHTANDSLNSIFDEWTNVVVTFLPDDKVKLYLNSVLMDSSALVPCSNFWNPSYFSAIGGYNGSSLWFKGKIDDVLIYNRALSPFEIQQLYTSQSYAWSTGATTTTTTVTPTTNTTYSCTVTQGSQTCTASVDITVTPQQNFYADVDGDGFGNPNAPQSACEQPAGFVSNANDCNDNEVLAFVGATDICDNGIDEDCSGADSTCIVLGCIDITACNFNASANTDDGSCFFPAENYLNCNGNCLNDSDADGVCDEIEVAGCTDNAAFNYNPSATNDDGSCEAVLTCEINAPVTGICAGESIELQLGNQAIASNSSSGWQLLIPSSSYFPSQLSVGLTDYDRLNNVVYSATKSSGINRIQKFDLNNLTVEQFIPSGGPGELYDHTYDFENNRLLAFRSGRDQVYSWTPISNQWTSVGGGSFDSESYGGRAFYNSQSNRVGYFGGYGWFAVKNWIWENNGSGWINTYSNNNNCQFPKRTGQLCLGNPANNEVYIFSGQGSCDGNQFANNCSLGSPWATDVGVYCWIKDLSRLNLNTNSIETILPPNHSSILKEGDIVFDYEHNTFYLLGGFVPSPTYNSNFGNVANFENSVYRYRVGVDSGFEFFNVSGTPPEAKILNQMGSHGGFYDAQNDRVVWIRNDGVFAFGIGGLAEGQYNWSTGATSNTISVSPATNTTYSCTVTNGSQTCTASVDITVTPQQNFYADGDGDGFGNPNAPQSACEQPVGFVSNGNDCNDNEVLAFVGATDICDNGIDEDCSGADSTCIVLGCTDVAAINFNPAANTDDGSCIPVVLGCTDASAFNYNASANTDDGYCIPVILGCTNSSACNFNELANTDDDSCILPQTETCNGLDDNCDGQVDEGLTLGSVTATSVTTALYPTCSGNALKSANLNNGANSPIIDGNGLDLWYSMTAQYNTLRASLSAAFGDNEIRLYSYNNGCFELMETEHEVYTTTTLGTGNQVLISDDLLVGQTYYIAVHNITGPMNTSAKMCFNHFVGSTCDHYYSNNTGVYNNVCTSFKAQYKGNATNYIFDILSATQNSANLNITPWSYTTTTANSVVPRLGTIFPVNMSNAAKVYTLRIPVIYAIPDAAGNYTSITANATTICTVTLNAELPIALRAADRCPNTKTTTSSISVDRTICGAQRYEWEFTQQLPSVQAPVTVLGGLNTTVFFLNNVPGMATGKTYNVRVRPIHANGEVGNWGTAQCLKTGTSGMVMQSESDDESGVWANNYSPRQAVALYPNPTSTGHFTLMSNASEEEVKQIVITDITGKMVFQSQVVMNGNSVEVEFGDLATGMYLVMVGEERLRLIVE